MLRCSKSKGVFLNSSISVLAEERWACRKAAAAAKFLQANPDSNLQDLPQKPPESSQQLDVMLVEDNVSTSLV